MKKLSTNLFLFALLCFIGATNAWADDNPVPSFTEVAKGIYTLDGDESGQHYFKKVIDLTQRLAIGQSGDKYEARTGDAATTAPNGFSDASTSRYQINISSSNISTFDFTFPQTANSYVITNVPHGINVNYKKDQSSGGTLTCTVNNPVAGSYLCLTYKVGASPAVTIADATEQYKWYQYNTSTDKLSFDLKSRIDNYLYTKAELYSPINDEIGNGDTMTKEHYDFIAMKTTDASSKTFIQDHKGLFNDRFYSDGTSGNVGLGTTGLWFTATSSSSNTKFTVKNLKKGDKIKINHTKGRIQAYTANMLSGTNITNSETATTVTGAVPAYNNLIPGEEYEVLTDGDFTAYAKYTLKGIDAEKYTDSEGQIKQLTAGNLEISSITITHATTLDPITLNSSGYATRYLTDPIDVSCLPHLKAWIATSCENGSLTFQEVKKIPANCGVLLVGEPNWIYFPAYASGSDDVSSNIFKGVTAAAAPILGTGENAYLLNGNSFKKAPETDPTGSKAKITANRAYLALTEAQITAQSETKSLASSYFIPYGEEATGISNVANAPVCKEGFYTLTGIRVAKPAHGVYIFNGKKIFVK